jgi:hypothetical protein
MRRSCPLRPHFHSYSMIRAGVTQYSNFSTGWTAGVRFPTGAETLFSWPPRLGWLCGPHSILQNVYRDLFPQGWCGRSVNLTTHLHLVSRLWMHGATPSFPQCVVEHRDNFTFYYYFWWNMVWGGLLCKLGTIDKRWSSCLDGWRGTNIPSP